MKVLIAGFVLLALGLASAVPQWPSGHFNNGKKLTDETATSQIFPVALVPVLVAAAPKVVAMALDLLRYAVCDNSADSQLQAFANIEEDNAEVMALVKVMNDLLTAEEKLNEVKQLNMKDSLTAEVELFDGQWIDTLKTKLKNAIYKIGGAAKKLLCKQ